MVCVLFFANASSLVELSILLCSVFFTSSNARFLRSSDFDSRYTCSSEAVSKNFLFSSVLILFFATRSKDAVCDCSKYKSNSLLAFKRYSSLSLNCCPIFVSVSSMYAWLCNDLALFFSSNSLNKNVRWSSYFSYSSITCWRGKSLSIACCIMRPSVSLYASVFAKDKEVLFS